MSSFSGNLSVDRVTTASISTLQAMFSSINPTLKIPFASVIGSSHGTRQETGVRAFDSLSASDEIIDQISRHKLPEAQVIYESDGHITCIIFENGVILRFAHDSNHASHSNFVTLYDFNTQRSFVMDELIPRMNKFYYTIPYPKREHIPDPQFYLVYYEDGYGFQLQKFNVEDFGDRHLTRKEFDLHYSPDFTQAYENMVMRLRNDSGGLYLLHGVPGSGKSTVLLQLAHSMKQFERKLIYFPPDMIEYLGRPEFVPFMMRHQNSVLLMEDIENILQVGQDEKRTKETINLLNLTDGVYSRVYNVAVVGTFNADRTTIDPALLRSSRLMFEWYFNKLPRDQANAVLKHHGIADRSVSEDVPLGDLFASIKDKEIITNVGR